MKCIDFKLTVLAIILIFSGVTARAEEGHDHSEKNKSEHHDEKQHNKENEDDHAHKDGESHSVDENDEDHANHADNEESDHDEEGGAKVGPNKGITEKSENGFKLSKEAMATFKVEFADFSDSLKVLPKSAIVHIKNGKFIYRVRDGWIQRVSTSGELKDGDQFITSGTGFIRGAELILSEGATHSH